MLSRKSLLQLLESQNNSEIKKTPSVVEEPDELSPKEEFQSIINEMNRKLKKNESAKKRKKKVVNKLVDFMGTFFPPQNSIDEFF